MHLLSRLTSLGVCVSGGGGVLTTLSFMSYCLIINVFSQRAVRTSLEKQLDPRGPSASRGGPYRFF